MIAVRLEGRLGNQLFQYAFIYATAKKINVKFYLDQSIDSFLLDKYFEIDDTPFTFFQKHIFSISGYKNLFSHYLKSAFYTGLRRIHQLKTINFNDVDKPADHLKKISDSCCYTGFFQSIAYFEHHEQAIINQFKIKAVYLKQYQDLAAQLPANKTLVVVHIRRGDYLHLDLNLPDSYYHQVIKSIEAANPLFVFISDDTDYVKNAFAYLDNKYISTNNEIVDFQLLQHGDICVLANSSFSWWGAWLNPNKNKVIYAPKFWCGLAKKKEFPLGISNNLNYNWITV